MKVYSLEMFFRLRGTVPPSNIGSIVEQCLLEDPAARPRLDLILTALEHFSS